MSRRRLEFAILGFGLVFLIVLAFAFRPGRRPSRGAAGRETLPTIPSAEEAGAATTVLKGFDYTETLRGKPLFHIQADRTVGFGPAAGLVPNVYVLERVALTVYPEQGEAVTVRSDRAEYDQRSKRARLSGNVHWTDERGALGETETLEFEPSQRLLTAPSPLHFTRGTFELTSQSGRYDVKTRQVFLNGPVKGTGTGEGSGGLTSLSAAAAVYRRDDSTIELSGRVSAASRSGDRLSSDRLVLKLEGDEGRLQWARAEGDVQGTLVAGPAGATGKGTTAPRRYTAASAAILFGSDGKANSLSLTGAPAEVFDPRGRVRASTIDVSFRDGRATSATARGAVHVDGEKTRADSEQASLSFTPAGEIETMELSGNVRMEGEDRSGRAEKAVDLPDRGVWILSGDHGTATVESRGSRISADRIEIDEKRHLLTAEGSARAVFTPAKDGAKGAAPGHAPALVGDPGKPTFGKARRMVLDDASHVASLTGGATLWQDASSLSGDAITLNDVERSAVAVGHTRTVVLSADAQDRKPGAVAPPSPAVVTARRVTYREKESQAVFEEDVSMTRGTWQSTASRAVAVFGEDRKIQRVEMTGSVTLADSGEGRSGRAEHATDWPREGKTVLEGSPAWVSDAAGNRVTGAVLTITERGRRVEVTAPEGGKTETIHRTRTS